MNHSSSPTQTFSYHQEPVPHIRSTPSHHHLCMKRMKKFVESIDYSPLHQKRYHNQESYPATNGSETFKGWNPSLTIASLGWQEGKSLPHSSATTSLRITRKSYSPKATTAPTTHNHFMHDQTPTLVEYSQGRRHTPSFQTKPSRQWSTSPSMARGTPPCEEKSNVSTMPIRRWRILPK